MGTPGREVGLHLHRLGVALQEGDRLGVGPVGLDPLAILGAVHLQLADRGRAGDRRAVEGRQDPHLHVVGLELQDLPVDREGVGGRPGGQIVLHPKPPVDHRRDQGARHGQDPPGGQIEQEPVLARRDVDEVFPRSLLAFVEAGTLWIGPVDLHAVVVVRAAGDLAGPCRACTEGGNEQQGRRGGRRDSHGASDDIRSRAAGGAPS